MQNLNLHINIEESTYWYNCKSQLNVGFIVHLYECFHVKDILIAFYPNIAQKSNESHVYTCESIKIQGV